MNRVLPRGAAIAAVALTASVVAACGSDSSGTSTTAGKGHRLEFELVDAGCNPADATVPAGPVTIAGVNNGSSKTDEIELKSADGIILGERENLAPGLSGDFTLTLKPGRYEILCTFQNEQRKGGTLTVTGDAAAHDDGSTAQLDRAVADYKAVRRDAQPLRDDRADRRELRRPRSADRRARQRRRGPLAVDRLPPHRADPLGAGHDQGHRALRASGDAQLIDDVNAQAEKVQAGLDAYRRDTPLGFALYSELTPQALLG